MVSIDDEGIVYETTNELIAIIIQMNGGVDILYTV